MLLAIGEQETIALTAMALHALGIPQVGEATAELLAGSFGSIDAIMEAGGFDKTKADMRAVVVVRQENGQTTNYTLNLQQVLEGTQKNPFYLKPFDTVYVPDKFSWF